MKFMINNTSAVKIEASKGQEFKELCRKRGVTQSETFLKAVMKAVNKPYNGPQGILKCRFKQKYGGKIDRLQKKTNPILIGARISPELKIKVLKICDLNKISESVYQPPINWTVFQR
jgi:hypothetical protein